MANIEKHHIMQIRSNILMLHQNVVGNQNFILSNIEKFEMHDRLLSILWVAAIALSNVLHVADETIRDQILVNDNSRF
jgi:hypothetical protein